MPASSEGAGVAVCGTVTVDGCDGAGEAAREACGGTGTEAGCEAAAIVAAPGCEAAREASDGTGTEASWEAAGGAMPQKLLLTPWKDGTMVNSVINLRYARHAEKVGIRDGRSRSALLGVILLSGLLTLHSHN